MRIFMLWISIVMLHSTTAQIDSSAPGCAVRCWENTKYVSRCLEDMACLCTEAYYQKSVFQCLYSQCDTDYFNIAVKHAVIQCSEFGGNFVEAIHPVPHHDDLRRRKEIEYLAGAVLIQPSGNPLSVNTLPTESAGNFPLQSLAWETPNIQDSSNYKMYPTESVAFPIQSAQNPPKSTTPVLPKFPLQSVASSLEAASGLLPYFPLQTGQDTGPSYSQATGHPVTHTMGSTGNTLQAYPALTLPTSSNSKAAEFIGETPPKKVPLGAVLTTLTIFYLAFGL